MAGAMSGTFAPTCPGGWTRRGPGSQRLPGPRRSSGRASAPRAGPAVELAGLRRRGGTDAVGVEVLLARQDLPEGPRHEAEHEGPGDEHEDQGSDGHRPASARWSATGMPAGVSSISGNCLRSSYALRFQAMRIITRKKVMIPRMMSREACTYISVPSGTAPPAGDFCSDRIGSASW